MTIISWSFGPYITHIVRFSNLATDEGWLSRDSTLSGYCSMSFADMYSVSPTKALLSVLISSLSIGFWLIHNVNVNPHVDGFALSCISKLPV